MTGSINYKKMCVCVYCLEPDCVHWQKQQASVWTYWDMMYTVGVWSEEPRHVYAKGHVNLTTFTPVSELYLTEAMGVPRDELGVWSDPQHAYGRWIPKGKYELEFRIEKVAKRGNFPVTVSELIL